MTHNHDPKSSRDWTLDHPWLYVYTVIASDLLLLLGVTYLLDWLKTVLP